MQNGIEGCFSQKIIPHTLRRRSPGIVNLFSFLDELSPPGRLYRAMSAHSLIKCPKKEHLFPSFREK
jgi:hypothetical protein